MQKIPANTEIKSHPLELNISGIAIAAFKIKYRAETM
jgi:hypothetical protein